jgi:ADP-ribose pyrophosphatase YjhB (NUDIX family)
LIPAGGWPLSRAAEQGHKQLRKAALHHLKFHPGPWPTVLMVTAQTTPRGLSRSLRALAFRIFYGLPPFIRRRIVRLGVGTYTVGAVVLATNPSLPTPREDRPDTGGRAGQAGPPPIGSLLMVRQPPGLGWSLPAGLLERDESPAAGAARELAEETGVKVTPEQLLPAVPNAVVHTKGRWIDLVYTVDVPGDTQLRVDGAEILEVAWHPVNALPQVTPATARLLGNFGLGPYAEYQESRR